jgi:hypothetical protein
MQEAQALITTHNGGRSRGASFLVALFEEIERAAREEREKTVPSHPSPAPLIQRQTARLYTLD